MLFLSIVYILQGDEILAKEWIYHGGVIGMAWRFLWMWQGDTPELYYRGNQVLCLFIPLILGVAFEVTATFSEESASIWPTFRLIRMATLAITTP